MSLRIRIIIFLGILNSTVICAHTVCYIGMSIWFLHAVKDAIPLSDNWCLCCSLFTSHICPCQSPCVFRSVKVERYEIRFPVGMNSVWFLAGQERHHRHWPSQVHFNVFFSLSHYIIKQPNTQAWTYGMQKQHEISQCAENEIGSLLSDWDMQMFLQIQVPVSQLASPGLAELSYTFRAL